MFTITPTAGPNGSISPATPQTVDSGGSRAFTITPASGYHVADVLVDGASIGPVTSHTFTNVTADHTISATFAIDIFTITPTAGPNGAISPSTPQTVDSGGSQAFTITPTGGYHVADVLVDDVSVGAVTSYTFSNVTADHTISATFAIDMFTITPTPPVHGFISPGTAQSVAFGENLTFEIEAADGYYVADVTVDGASVGPVTTYSFLAVDADHTIGASFAFGPQAGLDMTFGKTVVTFGGSTLLGGRLYDRDHRDRSGRPQRHAGAVSRRSYGPSWSIVDTFVTSSDPATLGRFFTTVSPTAPTYYRLRYVAAPQIDYGSRDRRQPQARRAPGAEPARRARVGTRPSLLHASPDRSSRTSRRGRRR